jgi:uncharacterized protein
MLDLRPTQAGVRFTVHVQPKASKTEVAGLHGDALKVRVAAPPVDGAANDELIKHLARVLGVAKTAVQVVAGASSRRKTIEVDGLTADVVKSRLLP